MNEQNTERLIDDYDGVCPLCESLCYRCRMWCLDEFSANIYTYYHFCGTVVELRDDRYTVEQGKQCDNTESEGIE